MGARISPSLAFAAVLVLPSCDGAPSDPAEATPREIVETVTETEPEPEMPPTRSSDGLYGHLKYDETDEPLGEAGRYRDTGRVVQLRTEAAQAFRAMQQAARKDGVELVPISGYRTKQYQDGLFSRAIVKHGGTEAAARWVAPPGYSEHHTGLAVDIGALDSPETDVETGFEDTAAFAWLKRNASRFEFEISFPRDNPQGVSYEPWHWRYTGAVARWPR